MKLGGRFTLSDDSHGTDQVGTNYLKLLKFVERVSIQELYYVTAGHRNDFLAANQHARKITLSELQGHRFWKSQV